MTKAYLNALHEEGTRQDLLEWIIKLDGENDALRAKLASARKALEIAKDAIEFYGLDDFEETTEKTLRDIESALKDLP
jgi:hypothetical protein